ncbi:MAG: CarD family transcriptional regulator, partial [Pseudomonadota bacterium]
MFAFKDFYITDLKEDYFKHQRRVQRFTPYQIPISKRVYDTGFKKSSDFTVARNDPNIDLIETLIRHFDSNGHRIRLIFVSTESSRQRMIHLLSTKDVECVSIENAGLFNQAQHKYHHRIVFVAIVPIGAGFVHDELCLISELDLFGTRILSHRKSARKRASNAIQELNHLNSGDLVVHEEHGIARFESLETLYANQIAHDCLRLIYDGGDRLYLPVENLDMLTRYSGENAHVKLDRLGASNWQARKAKIKQRLKDIAAELIKLAAERALCQPFSTAIPEGLYEDFVTGFPYVETVDQINAMHDIFEDLSSNKVMDRLICGDVGFGKTEIALRTAFIVVMNQRQVCLIAPTTLLAHQHYRVFSERFKKYEIEIHELSRLVPRKKQLATHEAIKN